jgi:hypothetical protein
MIGKGHLGECLWNDRNKREFKDLVEEYKKLVKSSKFLKVE